jgi:hypothetical protein
MAAVFAELDQRLTSNGSLAENDPVATAWVG